MGGADAINFSHFIGAVYGMERMMGRADNPLRRILNYASDKFLQPKLPVLYALTVRQSLLQVEQWQSQLRQSSCCRCWPAHRMPVCVAGSCIGTPGNSRGE